MAAELVEGITAAELVDGIAAAELVDGVAAAELVDGTTTSDCLRLREREWDSDEVGDDDDDLADFNEPTMIVGSIITSM